MNYNHTGIQTKLRQLSSKRAKIHRKFVVLICILTTFSIVLGVVLGGSFAYGSFMSLVNGATEISFDDVSPDNYYTIIYDSRGNIMEKLVMAGSNREEVSLDDIPDNLINAFVAIEDERYWIHNGVDLKGILRAGAIAVTTMSLSQGASTITQQLIKNSVFGGGSEQSIGAKVERKVQEQALAILLEKQLSKKVILENYLNTINLGSNCLGVQAAANRYFDKDVSELTLSEAAVIAAITQNPSAYNPIKFPENNQRRQQRVLSNMRKQGYITEVEYQEALADDVYSRIQISSSNSSETVFSYFTDAVIEQVITDLQSQLGYTQTQAYNLLYSGGLSIYTTMDSNIQKVVDEEVNDLDNYPYEYYSITYRLKVLSPDGEEHDYTESDVATYIKNILGYTSFSGLFDSKEDITSYIAQFKEYAVDTSQTIAKESLSVTLQPQVSMIIIDQATGYVKAVNGGRGEKTTNLALNRATQSTRQPGSTFKVLSTFAPAIDACNATLASVYYDSPVTADGQSFSNWWGDEYLGYVNLRDCIAYSMNLPTLHCLLDTVSIDLAYNYVEKFGITTLVDYQKNSDGTVYTDRVSSLALGGLTKGVTNLELTAAYSAIANDGVYIEPTFYTRVLNHDGVEILTAEQKTSRVIKSTTASLLTYGMESTFGKNLYTDYTDINPNIIATGEGFGFDGMSLAGKSGSTTDNNDVWFVGYSPYYTCGIWSGYDKGKTLVSGQTYQKDIWKRVMERIHKNLSDIGWKRDADIVTAKICSKSGLLAVDGVCGCGEDHGVVYTEYFTSQTVPKQYCTIHEEVSICSESNRIAGDYCPEDDIITKVYIRLTKEQLNTSYTTDDMKYAISTTLGKCSIHVAPTTTEPETTQAQTTKARETSEDEEEE
ncbi:MAG: transglycosylase domain-containing protein [Lachnospiraceae bacterium]|nr:transglycosylase domain-containing protein [Lachnospiraceae bacterium]